MTEFVAKLAQLQEKDAVRTFRPVKEKTAYTSSSQVQYVARCGNYRKAGYEYTGALKVLKIIFSYDYLWLNVRVKGGAYGCMEQDFTAMAIRTWYRTVTRISPKPTPSLSRQQNMCAGLMSVRGIW